MSSKPPYPDVTVLLGDPRLPDVSKVEHRFSPEDLEAVERMQAALGGLPGYRFTYHNDHTRLLQDFLTDPPSFVFNLADTGFRNDAARELHIPAWLELLEVPYSGAGPACLGLCYDKAKVRAIAAAADIPVPAETFIDRHALAPSLPGSYPALIKPSTGDGSVGITQQAVVHDVEEAAAYIDRLRAELPDRHLLIQEFLDGPEYAIGLIGNPGQGFTVLPPLTVDYSGLPPELPRILSYESKTVPSSPYWTAITYREAQLAEEVRDALVDHAYLLFARLGCRDYARFDFRSDAAGTIKLLEVNPNPAWCWDGKMNLMAGFAGISYTRLLELILEAAQYRTAAKEP